MENLGLYFFVLVLVPASAIPISLLLKQDWAIGILIMPVIFGKT